MLAFSEKDITFSSSINESWWNDITHIHSQRGWYIVFAWTWEEFKGDLITDIFEQKPLFNILKDKGRING